MAHVTLKVILPSSDCRLRQPPESQLRRTVQRPRSPGPQLLNARPGLVCTCSTYLNIPWTAYPVSSLVPRVAAPDAQWYGAEDGQLCNGREAIVEMMSRNLAGRLQGRVEEAINMGRV